MATGAAILVVVVSIVGLALVSLTGSDRRSAEVERLAVRAFLEERAQTMYRSLVLVADDLEVRRGAESGRSEDLHRMLGRPLHERFSYERTYLLDARGQVVYASVDGQMVTEGPGTAQLMSAFPRLVNRLSDHPETPLAGFLVADREVGFATLRGLRHDGNGTSTPSVLLSVTVDLVDSDFLEGIAKRLQVVGLRIGINLRPDPDQNSVELVNLASDAPVRLVWHSKTASWLPGMQAAPVIAGLSSLLLVICIIMLLRMRRTSRALRESQARMTALAYQDYLTGLANRGYFVEQLDKRLKALDRDGPLMLVFIDLDGFKDINDTLGHAIGDDLLRVVADRISDAIGPEGLAARFGGDEFVVYFTSKNGEEAPVPRLLATMQKPIIIDGHPLHVRASMGGARAPEQATDARDLMRLADIALYRAKDEGRGAFRIFEPELEAELLRRRKVEIELRAAIEQNQLVLLYQPQVDVESERVVGFEVLVRWDHPAEGRLLPEAFIPVAERSLLITLLDAWVLRTACREGKALGDVTLSVNMSALNFRQPDIAEQVMATLAETGFDPARLELEITESAIFQADATVLATLTRLRAAGVRIALDDFGTGHASLVHVRSFPVTKIKIDRSFIANLGIERDAAAIVEYVVRLGRSLGIVLTAEGVETREQLRFLRAFGTQQAQGYLFAPPLPLAEALRLMARQRRAASGKATSRGEDGDPDASDNIPVE